MLALTYLDAEYWPVLVIRGLVVVPDLHFGQQTIS